MNKTLREKFLGSSLKSSRKSYYPQLRQQLETVKENERRLQLIIDNVPARIAYVDKKERYVFVNREYEKVFGLSRHQIVGEQVQAILKDNYHKAKPYIDDALRGRSLNYEAVFTGLGGEQQWLHITYVPDIGTEGEVLGFYVLTIDFTEMKHTREALRYKDALLGEIGALVKIGGWEFDPATGKGTWSDEVARIHDLDPKDESSLEKGLSFYHGESRKKIEAAVKEAVEKGRAYDLVLELISAKGIHKWVRAVGQPILKDGKVVQVRGAFQDITERIGAEKEQQALQDQLHQVQKIESVGRLAGGVAHDYNNFLGVIIGYTELSMMGLDPGSPLHRNLKEVLNAANRSKAVTRQLLAFARKEAIVPEILDLNTVVESMLKIIRRLIGENIELIWQPKANLWPVKMDPSQVDQILANLCVNARDAIDDVGKVFIQTENVTVDHLFRVQHPDIDCGDFVALIVSDNGRGMDRETLDKIFEPFFTTKELGKGTGLGLSTVYGIVKQNKGAIKADSAPNTGTTLKIYLPRHEGPAEESGEQVKDEIPVGSGETILVVEDETAILGLAKRILEKYGYRVLTAASPAEALKLATVHSTEISLVITDVIMPEMNGRDLVEKLKGIIADLKYLFISGYTADAISASGVMVNGTHFLQKPFTSEELAVKARQVLDAAI